MVVDDLDEVESTRIALLEALQETPAGAVLAELLASVDRSSLDAEGLLRLAQARQRLIAHQEAEFLADLHAIARTVPDQGAQPGRRDQPGRYPWAEVEAACALRWTYPRAAERLIFADEVIDRLPAVHAALAAGSIDVAKARVMVDAVAGCDDELARRIVDGVIEAAPGLTTGQLRARLRRLVLACDPAATAARARQEVKGRRVVAYPDERSHLASLCGYELPPHRVAAAVERLDAIARAAKAAGDRRRMDQLRADAYLDLLTGDGVAVGGPITCGDLDGRVVADGPEDAITAGAPTPTGPADPGLLADPEPEPAPAGPECDLWAGGVAEPPADLAGEDEVVDVAERDREALWSAGFPALPTTPPTCARCAAAGGGVLPAPRRGVVELQVPLTTLLGLSQLPGQLGGFAPVVADIARQVAAQMRDAIWRFSIYNRLGELVHHGVTNQRPTTGRFPTAQLAAFVKARDRTCVAPGCRRPARMCDVDHTVPWAKGGPTEVGNLGLLCRLHHLFKHSRGCELLQPSPGIFWWKFPSGLQYLSTPDPPLLDDNELTGLPKPVS